MSRIGKKPVIIPKGVEVKIDGSLVNVKGPRGELKREFSDLMKIWAENNQIVVKPKGTSNDSNNLWGLTRALLANMIKGVTDGFEENLEFNGIGFKAAVKGNTLEMSLGFSHPVVFDAFEGVSFKVEKNRITVGGIDKEAVGQVTARIRAKKKPEPYKGTGIFYKGETITRKAGKKAATIVG